MLLQFPDIDTISLAISSGTIPESVVSEPLDYFTEDDGSVWIQTAGTVPRATVDTLKSWGVAIRRGAGRLKNRFQTRQSWLQVIPLRREAQFQRVGDRTQTLFELSDEAVLPDLVNEILRQGNDRQSFRRIGSNGDARVLLRVIGAPYYSLLRASEQWATGTVRAFVEQSPRIWTEAGYQHPFAERITPAVGQHLLIQADSQWRTLKEQPFQDVYSAIEFVLPEDPQPLTDTEQPTRLQVPVRLSRSSEVEPAEVFVLTRNAVEQLDQFVQSSADSVLDRLAFAVVQDQASQEPTVVIRIRPGRTAAPVLVFDGLACRNILKIPNLYVPVGKRIHPPLRRDAIRDLLAKDESQLVWLVPDSVESNESEASANGSVTAVTEPFVARSIPDSAFLPLTNWVDYVLDRDQETLTTWRQSHQFDFEGFICKDDKPAPEKKKAPKKQPADSSKRDTKATEDTGSSTDDQSTVKKLIRRFRRTDSGPPEDAEVVRLKAELDEAEKRFLAMTTQLDDPDRLPMWNEMADLNAALDRHSDSSICRQHQIWDDGSPDPQLFEVWFCTDVRGAEKLGSLGLLNQEGNVTDLQLRKLLKSNAPTPPDIEQLASWIAWATHTEDGRELVQSQQAGLLTFLERYESSLGVRACWLAWSSLAGIDQDTLTLARARDRILDRIYQHGLTADRDLPSFLRSGGSQSGERFRQIRDKVRDLQETVHQWSADNLGVSSAQTKQYIDLIFAFAFARLGETSTAINLVHAVEAKLLAKPDAVHQWLFDAYRQRIESVVNSQPATGPFSKGLLDRLQNMDRLDRYKVDRLRQHSGILEPMEKLDPYREWRRRDDEDLEKQLADLFVENNHEQLAARLQGLLDRKLAVDEEARVLTTALELSTRLGERFATGLLAEIVPLDTKLSDPIVRAQLLEKGLQIGAHYDHPAFVQDCFTRMTQLLEDQKKADLPTLEALESLLVRSFHTLRKLGMRDEIAFLLEAMSKVVRDFGKGKGKEKGVQTERLRVLLQLAGAWFYFGQDRGWKDIDAARDILLSNKLTGDGHVGAKKQTDLAVAYINAVGQAPLNEAVDRLQDLFRNLNGIRHGQTVSSHYSLKQLDIVEALVQTIVSDSFTMDKNSQRWMDEEEFLIRRRIHRDMRAMLKQS